MHSKGFDELLNTRLPTEKNGMTDDTAVLVRNTTRLQFDDLMKYLYQRQVHDALLSRDYYSTNRLIDQIYLCNSVLHNHTCQHPRAPAAQLQLACKFNIPEWLPDAVARILRWDVREVTDTDVASIDYRVLTILIHAKAKLEHERRVMAQNAPITVRSAACQSHQECMSSWGNIWWDIVARRLLHPEKPLAFSQVSPLLKRVTQDRRYAGLRDCLVDTIAHIAENSIFPTEADIVDGAVKEIMKSLRLLMVTMCRDAFNTISDLVSISTMVEVVHILNGFERQYGRQHSIRQKGVDVLKLLQRASTQNPSLRLELGSPASIAAGTVATPHVPKHESSYTKILSHLFEFTLGRIRGEFEERAELVSVVQELLQDASIPAELHALLSKWVLVKDDGVKSKKVGEEIIAALEELKPSQVAAERVFSLRSHLNARSRWIIGSDAWSYDLGASGLHHAIASKLNINILILDTLPYSARNTSDPSRRKQDVGLYAMNHGDVVIKCHLQSAIQDINRALLDTLAACGDVNRNVIVSAIPSLSKLHAQADEFAKRVSERLLPRTTAYHEIWLDKKLVAGDALKDVEPLYGVFYLPRKFKVAVAVPPTNDVDIFANDVGFIAIVDEKGEFAGFNVTAGGGMAARMGLDVFKGKVEKLLGYQLQPAHASGKHHFTCFIENGRIQDEPDHDFKAGLREIAKVHKGTFRLTANQHLVVTDVVTEDLPQIKDLLAQYKLDNLSQSALRLSSSACVVSPTCSLAMAESERYLPILIDKVEKICEENGLHNDSIVMRMTGCPNGCARPYVAEVAFVGKAPGTYLMLLGGGYHGQRLNKIYRETVTEPEILAILKPMIKHYALERHEGEHFGDFVIRAGYIAPTTSGKAWKIGHNVSVVIRRNILSAISFHYGENHVWACFTEYAARFARLAPRDEDATSTTTIGYPSMSYTERPGEPRCLGSGITFVDEVTCTQELVINTSRIEVWWKTESYQQNYIRIVCHGLYSSNIKFIFDVASPRGQIDDVLWVVFDIASPGGHINDILRAVFNIASRGGQINDVLRVVFDVALLGG
ncbi:hypothetical protein CERSUDRAFT_77058 [Gelatoporia subvermispora B]|uniref:assimilatory sulfite reductase (NADPH) n=1 Tax=Ceriporiopsis subvermispora (strain B) TaxID=914234 RepID=M2Q870_CERS8|nr:hypothetical protein CERSUDRAFT_77058 [Gelatoporia subvermispora B]